MTSLIISRLLPIIGSPIWRRWGRLISYPSDLVRDFVLLTVCYTSITWITNVAYQDIDTMTMKSCAGSC